MSNPISQGRQDVAAALAAVEGLKVYPFIPKAIVGNTAVVSPGTPYVRPGQVMGELTVTLSVRLFAKQGSNNEVVSEALDDLIVSVCHALKGYGVVNVSQPGVDAKSYDQPYLAADITITFSV